MGKRKEVIQQSVRRNIAAKCGEPPITHAVRFLNEDVPAYLKQLELFEAKSREARAIVK